MWLPSVPASAIALLAWSALAPHAAAQVTTPCFPMNVTCPPNPAFGMDLNFNFNRTPNVEVWETTVGPVNWHADTGAGFTISKMGDSPTIRSKFYYFWGRTEVHLKAAKGTGVISSIMMLSDNLDEIDWEFFGGNETVAQSNYFGKGVQPDVPNAIYHPVDAGVQNDYHNYTTVWTKDALDFWIDGNKVRTLLPKDANNTYFYPQTPMRLSIGIWAGGDPRMPKGTREWAGGDTDYSQAPFDMFVKSAHVADYSSGKEYEYTDKSGTWESIKVVEGNSTVKEIINAPPDKTLAEKWNDLPNGAKIGIYAGAAGFVGLLLFTGLFYCIRQRRRGAREAKAAEARAEAERLELERFRKAGVDPDSFASDSQAHEYNAKDMRRDGFTDEDSYSVPGSPNLKATTPASPLDHRYDSAAAAALAVGVGAGGAAAAAGGMRSPVSPVPMRSPVPLLRDGAQSPRVASPGPGRGPGQGIPAQAYAQPPNRSYTSPGAQMRMGSPGPQQLAHPQPQRSFTTDAYGDRVQGGYGGYHEQDQGHGGGNGNGNGYGQGGRGNDGYWGNGGGYNR
ncbi:concanavalin A-like lectin/glucanase domain-containing protein [Parachaetomium inaequale]|uniref:chitinase n=1 Tax=Parachaetomium inaequale TaxID=2588326 RepID=A0AAN6PK05_9PEZI|nr:concanavalin A-like lectin/glucanase domain-containing protein [Parachaetomium inaequale]